MRLDIKDIIIDRDEVLKFLGYGKRKQPPIILKKIDEEIEKSKELFDTQVFLKHFKIEKIKDVEVSFGDFNIKSNYVARELENSSSVYIALYSIGDYIEDRINEYSSSTEMIRAMILDKIGVVALDYINHKIKEEINKKINPMNISAQLYPSQKDFHISNQVILLNAFREENTTITISKHFQMYPIKTVVVLFGVGKDKDKYSMCDRCENKCY
ncbi:hypothetical protein [Clostridium cylindrosporum]|uniref:AdoMet activation domain-containing protein n=1 Tax=Clostridium cylindrosporum DSM 605 TaxID=1121307 RepID=A0A0J8D4D0_CLOCY|nr:hypothetical protein [Clostridium cylindrosporum]KMT21015.1 hypothetical protein CLCY_1c02490 [Clostridium cylindrosporum DSM 605]